MSQPGADRNLLFGVLALQMDFIKREQLIAAMQAWVFDKGKPLGEILCAQKALAEDSRALLEALVQKHLAQHGNDAEKSLAAVSSVASVKRDLEKIADADVQTSLGHIPLAKAGEPDLYATVSPSALMAGASGSRFRILRPHARGGLGEVFVARDEELNREVALKEIQDRQADNADSRSRFVLEAEITGGLEHPGIVPVYGLGTYADGRPYYAMRFIRGDSLKDAIERFHKADAAGMDPGQRTLELRGLLGRFVDVCNAIAYAHSRGVLHRDLKPGNIMLGKYGETLVVDWGLAKPLGQPMESTAQTEPGEGSLMPSSMGSASQTLVGAAVGTPQYMSPEQAGGRLDQLGPASDVYSLGATLYCLLTGQPSIADPDVGVMLQKVQRGDILRPRDVKKNVPIPLEAICLKAMMLKPGDRYATPRLLADDIEHWLADEPVSAWPEPWTVKAQRWLSRHRTLVTGVAAAVLVALIGLIATAALLTAANDRERKAREFADEQKELAQANEKEARAQKEKAEQNFQLARSAVDRYHTEVSEDVLLKEPGQQPLRKKLLEAAREFYEKFVKERANDKSVQGELGKATFRLAQITGDIDSELKAIDLHQQAVQQLETLTAGQNNADFQRDLADCYHHLGRLYRLTDQMAKSEAAYQQALTLWQKLAKEFPDSARIQAGLARTQLGLGNVYQVTRHLDKAQKSYQQALDIRKALAAAHPKEAEYQRDLAVTHNNLAMILKANRADEADAEKLLQAAQAIQKQLTEDAPTISQYQNDLARTDRNLGDLYAQSASASRAEEPYNEAAKRWEYLTDRHPAVTDFQVNLAETYSALAMAYRKNQELKKAAETCQAALAIQRKLALKHPNVPNYQGDLGRGLITLGEVYRSDGQSKKAETAYEEAVRIQEKLASDLPKVPHYQSSLARTFNSVGLLYMNDKDETKAADAFNRALTAWRKLIKDHAGEQEYILGESTICYNLGNLARSAKNDKGAVDWYTRALENIDLKKADSTLVKDALRNAYWMRAATLTQMGRAAESLNDWDRAVELAPDRLKPALQLPRMAALARAGKYMEASNEASQLVAKAKGGDVLYRFACVYSLSAAAASADVQRSPDERQGLADQFSMQAVKLLAAADEAGFFKTPSNQEKLKADPDLQALRARADFKKLESTLKTK
jgi:serine/threonine protein kinase/tetratricopeptide (TPR) repeat protein